MADRFTLAVSQYIHYSDASDGLLTLSGVHPEFQDERSRGCVRGHIVLWLQTEVPVLLLVGEHLVLGLSHWSVTYNW
jgi:hypothetical protein